MVAASGCSGSGSDADTVTVFAAASLTEVFTELGAAFETENPDIDVQFSFAASSDLAIQMIEGAPVDVYASADTRNMDRVIAADVAVGEPAVFATNRAEIVVEPDNPLGIVGVADLAERDLVLVVCAPEVPCGAYAQEVVTRAGIEITPDSFEENVRAVVSKVALGEADAGIAYATDVIAAGDQVSGVEIPTEFNVTAEYPIVAVSERSGSQRFVDFVQSAGAQATLELFGFGPP